MQVFITGASGYVGGVVAAELARRGHRVSALARTELAAERVRAAGAEPVHGALEDARVLQAAAGAADAVVHAAVDYADPGFGPIDERAVAALVASRTPVLLLSTTLVYGDTGPAPVTEDRPADPGCLQPFKLTGERRVLEAGGTVLRLGLVHGRGGNLTLNGMLAGAAAGGAATCIDEGGARWSCVHVDDVADLVAAALERPRAGRLLNAAAEDAPSMRELAEAVGAVAGVPAASITLEAATAAMGPFAVAFTRDLVVDATRAARELGWRPHRAPLLEELRTGGYAVPAAA